MRIKTEVPKKILNDLEVVCGERPWIKSLEIPDGDGDLLRRMNAWDNSARSVAKFFKERLFK